MRFDPSLGPVAASTAAVLRALFPKDQVADRLDLRTGIPVESGARFLVLSYSRDFDFLWELRAGFLGWLRSGARTVVLVWDRTPGDGPPQVPLGKYLTPIDWAAAAALIPGGDSAAREPGPWNLIVVRTAAGSPATPARDLEQRLRASHQPLLPHLSVVELADSGSLLRTLLQAPPASGKTDRALVKRLWSDTLVSGQDRESRHALVNVLDQLLLLGAAAAPRAALLESQHARALLGLARALGLAPAPGPSQKLENDALGAVRSAWHGVQPDATAFLVDDHADLGWAAFLRHVLQTGRNQFEARTDPRVFLEEILDPARVFDEVVLFLDLHLFPNLASSRDFARDAARLVLDGKPDLHRKHHRGLWHGFDPRELRALVEGRAEDDSVLTLLPRIVALARPMLPVILFSSTGRREIVERLRPYGSIVTSFSKPRLAADGITSPKAVLADLQDAISQAGRTLSAARSCRAITRLAPKPRTVESVATHFEVFVEESGTGAGADDFVVGGLLLGFTDEAAATSFHVALPKWGFTRDGDRVAPANAEPKRPSDAPGQPLLSAVEDRIAKALRLSGAGSLPPSAAAGSPPEVWLFSVSKSREETSRRNLDDLSDPRSLDNRYRRLLSVALELVLFEVLPESLRDPAAVTCSVFVAQRLLSKAAIQSDLSLDGGAAVAMLKGLSRRYGVEYRTYQAQTASSENEGVRVVGPDDVHPVVAELRRRRSTQQSPRFPVARAVRLLSFLENGRLNQDSFDNKELDQFPRQGHYVADLVCHWRYKRDRSPEVLDDPSLIAPAFRRGFDAVDGQWLETCLEASRLAVAKRPVDAIVHACRAELDSPTRRSRVADLVRSRVARCIAGLTGREFVELCARL